MQKRLNLPPWIKRQNLTAIVVILSIGIIGVIIIFTTKAATPYVSINADKGTLGGAASSQNDFSASDGRSVTFGGNNPLIHAASAFSFTDSIGVGTHIYFLNTTYGNIQGMINSLQTAGIKHIRDGFFVPINSPWPTYLSDEVARYRAVEAAGIYTDLGIGGCPNGSNDHNAAGPQQWVNTAVYTLDMSKVDFVELTNEIDNFCPLPNQPPLAQTWLINAVNYIQQFHDNMKMHPQSQNIPIIGPSFVYSNNPALLGDMTKYIDFGNIHPYQNGDPPSSTYVANDQQNMMRPVSGNKPLIATEVGNTTGNVTAQGAYEIPPVTQAVYALNTYLDHYLVGVPRSYMYELLDDGPDPGGGNSQSHFGLVNSDFSPKPAYNAIKNMISLLSDSGNFQASSLAFTVKGANPTTKELLLQKKDGTFWLVVWQNDSIYDRVNHVNIPGSSVPLTINFNKPMTSITQYYPILTTNPINSTNNTASYSFNASPNALLLHIVP